MRGVVDRVVRLMVVVVLSFFAASLTGAAHHGLAYSCGGSGPVTCTFSYTGAEEQFVVPAGVTSLSVTAVGARGADDAADSGGPAGFGAVVTTTLTVSPGNSLWIDVGGNGSHAAVCGVSLTPGGFNGGGAANPCAGSGGGASGIYGAMGAATPLVVAGGGGGGGQLGGSGGSGDAPAANGGSPGPNGGDGAPCTGVGGGGGGTQAAGGTAGVSLGGGSATDGTAGRGGEGSNGDGGSSGGGGGGGYFGGGGGGKELVFTCGGGGGAGSSYTDSGLATGTVYGTDSTGTPEVTISYIGPTAAAYSRLVVSVSHGWTTMHWVSITHVAGFNVYRGSSQLNHRLITGVGRKYEFHLHQVVRHPRVEAVPLH